MAQKFILLSVLWIVVAIFETEATATTNANTAATTNANTAATTDAATAATTDADTAATADSPTTAGSGTSVPPTSSDPCNPNPCGLGSTCAPRAYQSHVCLCLPGDFYNNKTLSCENAKVFPGRLALSDIEYVESMKDPNSKKFKNTSDEIIGALDAVFETEITYSGSTVLELQPITNAVSRSDNGVTASVDIIFLANSPIKADDVSKKITSNICKGCVLEGATFENTDLCGQEPCDTKTTNCTSIDGSYECNCLKNYIPTDFSTRMCTACPSGYQAQDTSCVSCPFGYSGFNCSENWKLVLVIVGSVLGGLLLIAFILLPVVATMTPKKSSKKSKNEDMDKPQMSQLPAKLPLVNSGFDNSHGASFNGSANGQPGFSNAGMSRFPRAATTTSSWDNRTNLQMTPSRQNFGPVERSSRIYDDPDDVNTHTRSQNNPYAQNQPKINPYAQNQGHTNPYYMHDNGRRLY